MMRKKKVLLLFLSALIIVPAVYPLFTVYVPGTADGLAHKFRLVSFHRSLNEGNLRPRWLADTALGFGSPIFLFNYLLPYYIVDFFFRTGFSVNRATQIFQAATLLASFVSMYLLAGKLWGKKAGLAAAAVYTWAPYHLLSVYVYEGWGEMTAFIFPPIIIFFILKLSDCLNGKYLENQKSKIKNQNYKLKVKSFKLLNFELNFCILHFAFCILFWFLLILSHNVSAVMFAPIILGLGLAWDMGNKGDMGDRGVLRKNLRVLLGFILALFISAFFWLPAVTATSEIAYPALIAKEAGMRFLYFKPVTALVSTAFSTIQKGSADYYDFTLGLPIILIGLISLIRLIRQMRITLETGLLAIFFISLYLVTPSSSWIWSVVAPLKYIVYPYRFLFPATFAGSLLAGWWCGGHFVMLNLFQHPLKNRGRPIYKKILKRVQDDMLMPTFFIILAIISGRPYTRPYVDVFPFDDKYFQQVQTVFSAPQTKKNMASIEFLPKKASLEFLKKEEEKYYTLGKLPEKFILSPLGGKIISEQIGVEKMSLLAETEAPTTVTVNTFFFPNWQAFVDGKRTAVTADEVGRIKIDLPVGRHEVRLVFAVFPIEKISYVISAIGIVIFLCIDNIKSLV